MPAESRASRTPWIIVGAIVLVVVVLFALPQSVQDQLGESVKAFILKIHNVPRK